MLRNVNHLYENIKVFRKCAVNRNIRKQYIHKRQKGEKEMTNNIGGINGYGYGINPWVNGRQNKDLNNQEAGVTQDQTPQPQTVNVDPNQVLNFLASSAVKVNPPVAANAGVDDAAVAERIDGYVQNFEMLFSIIAQEFGEKVANQLLNDDAFVDAIMA